MSPARDERRQAVLGLLAQHGAVEWHGYGQDVAFADEVLELAARLGRVETVPAMRPVRVATDAQRQAAMAQIRERLNGAGIGLSRPVSDEQGVSGVRGSGAHAATGESG
jgi:hypothetical protein